MFGSRSSLAGWILVAVLSFPFALIVGLSGRVAHVPAPTTAVVVASLIIVVLRMVAWCFFWFHWRKAERRRQIEANRRLIAIAESSRELLWETRDERFVYLAPTVAEYLGYLPEELLGKATAMVFADFERPRAAALARACSTTACGWRDEEYTFRAKNGELRDFLSSGLAQTNKDGKVIGFAGTLRGIDGLSERQQTEQLRSKIRKVIDNQSMRTVFQVIIDTTSGLAVGAEALTRFPPEESMMTPEKWFSAAARAGLGVELELAALRQALCAGSAGLPPDLFLSVNVSPATVLSGTLEKIIDESGWSPAMMVVEITEHVSIENYAELSAHTTSLRRRGLRLAVDDAGAGYASFRHILALRPDYIKLDRALIAGIDNDPGKRALIKAVTSFAGDIGATVIAEGIENGDELCAATLLGVQGAQGFFICEPSPVADWPQTYLDGPIKLPAPLSLL
jgi:PAS domain S-box-containing protein